MYGAHNATLIAKVVLQRAPDLITESSLVRAHQGVVCSRHSNSARIWLMQTLAALYLHDCLLRNLRAEGQVRVVFPETTFLAGQNASTLYKSYTYVRCNN